MEIYMGRENRNKQSDEVFDSTGTLLGICRENSLVPTNLEVCKSVGDARTQSEVDSFYPCRSASLDFPDKETSLSTLLSSQRQLANTILHLERSNKELAEADPEDEDFRLAIEENKNILIKKKDLLKKINDRISILEGTGD